MHSLKYLINTSLNIICEYNWCKFYLFVGLSYLLFIIYFRIASHFNILDRPNNRSSHNQDTIRGAGFIFPIIFILNSILFNREIEIIFILGLLIISILSFWDDVVGISPGVRLLLQIISVLLLLFSHSNLSLWVIILSAIIIIGIVNAYNFMDGINGITVLYSATQVFSLIWVRRVMGFESNWYNDSLFMLFSSFLVFGFYNLRRKARCFAGDIGSVAMAFILCYGIFDVIIQTSNPIYILFLGIYGLDTVATITLRICRKENLTVAHRTHLYQFLSNEQGFTHVFVAILFASVQLVLSTVVITQDCQVALLFYVIIIFVYIAYRLKYQGFQNLFVKYVHSK
jgi:UDP-GlcNAc:undecaprenyl-phosphate GlcNAc-1-phosphate transferase